MGSDILGLVVSSFIFIIILCFGFMLRSGHGASFISIYFFMSKEKKALYNERALCRFVGNLLFLADLYILIVVIAGILEITWLIIFLTICLTIFFISMMIYVFTSPKYRN